MYLGTIIVILVRIIMANKVEKLKWEDLNDNRKFLVFIYLKSDFYQCSACEYFTGYLNKIKIPVKIHNFLDDIELASRFRKFTFPVFVLRNNLRSYNLEPTTGEELVGMINGCDTNKMIPFSSHLEVNSIINKLQGKINFILYKTIEFWYFISSYIGMEGVMVIVFLIIIYLIYSIAEIILTKDEIKVKTE